MFNKNLYKVLILIPALGLVACSASHNDYKALIDEYEEKLAEETIKDSIKLAQEVSAADYPNVRLLTFMNFQIPTHYQSYHKSLGIDVSKLNYQDVAWMSEIRGLESVERRYAEDNPELTQDHSSHGH